MRLLRLASQNRWPLFVVGLLAMSVSAQAVMVFVATRPSAGRPYANYYQHALQWDADSAVLAASRALGWTVSIDIPRGPELAFAELRPVDVTIADRDGQPVTGLEGQVVTTRAADSRAGGATALVALPQTPGRYRSLARLPQAGQWVVGLDAHLGATRFVFRTLVELAPEAPR
jgi:nitrogen fixation protein FixH